MIEMCVGPGWCNFRLFISTWRRQRTQLADTSLPKITVRTQIFRKNHKTDNEDVVVKTRASRRILWSYYPEMSLVLSGFQEIHHAKNGDGRSLYQSLILSLSRLLMTSVCPPKIIVLSCVCLFGAIVDSALITKGVMQAV
jgi:hypothetical protein